MNAKKISFLAAAAVAGGVFAFGTSAQAKTVNQVLFNVAQDAGTLGVPNSQYQYHDGDFSYYDDVDGNGIVSTGDIVYGSVDYTYLKAPSFPGTEEFLSTQGNADSLYGRYAIQVLSANSSTGAVDFGVVGTATGSSAVNPLGGNTMFAIYEGAEGAKATNGSTPGLPGDPTPGNAGGFYNSALFGSSADLYVAFGFDSTTYLGNTALSAYQLTFRDPTDLTLANALSGSGILADITKGYFQIVDDGTSDGGQGILSSPVVALSDFGTPSAAYDISLGGNISHQAGLGLFSSSTDTNVNLTIVPTPQSALSAIALLGLLGIGYGYRRHRMAA